MMHRTMAFSGLVVLGLLLLAVAPAQSRTWTVELDGSGDFTQIQAAVDAASDGDEIRIGTGRFDHYQTIVDNGHTWDIHVFVPDGLEVSFFGSGVGQTIIGPSNPESHNEYTYGFAAIHDVDLAFRDLTIENCNHRMIGMVSGALRVERCSFSYVGTPGTDTIAIDGGFSDGAEIRDCEFLGVAEGVATISSVGGVTIERCRFECGLGVYAWTSGSSEVTVFDSEFDCDNIGIAFLSGAGGTIEQCRLENCILELTDTAEVTVIGSVVYRNDGGVAVLLSNNEPVIITNNVFESNGMLMRLGSYGLGTIRENHFVCSNDGYWIYCPYHPTFQQDIDLSGNYWGTTNIEEIAEGIWDCQDDDHAYHCVIFEPIADGPVSVEQKSWGSVKGLFESGGEE